MRKNLVILALAVIFSITGCDSKEWQPYVDGSPEIAPDVTFSSLLDCQQYLHFRFGNIIGTSTLYCIEGCTKSEDVPKLDQFRIGILICPLRGKQIVGQLVHR